MDLLGDNPPLNLSDRNFRIYSRNSARPPQFVGTKAHIVNSRISEGCRIYGRVENSVLSGGVIVEEGAVVKDAVVLANSTIKAGASVSYSIIDENVTIGKNAVIGVAKDPSAEIVVLGRGINVADGVVVSEGQKHESDITA
jgi:glucose-1-phosphate adenylyltransferase